MPQVENACQEELAEELLSLKVDIIELKAPLSIDKTQFDEITRTALAECAEQREQLARIRAECAEQQEQLAQRNQQQQAMEPGKAANFELIEAVRELERLEHALVAERQRNAALLEEKRISEERHARDIAMLESMVQSITMDNRRLSDELAAKKDGSLDSCTKKLDKQPVVPSSEVDEPEMEANPCNKLDSYCGVQGDKDGRAQAEARLFSIAHGR